MKLLKKKTPGEQVSAVDTTLFSHSLHNCKTPAELEEASTKAPSGASITSIANARRDADLNGLQKNAWTAFHRPNTKHPAPTITLCTSVIATTAMDPTSNDIFDSVDTGKREAIQDTRLSSSLTSAIARRYAYIASRSVPTPHTPKTTPSRPPTAPSFG